MVVDEWELVREGVARVVEAAGHTVVAEAGSAREAAARAAAVPGGCDAAVVDARLRDGDSLELVARLRGLFPIAGIVLMESRPSDGTLFGAMDAGANAVVDTAAPAGVLVARLEQAAADPASFSASGLAAAVRRRRDDPGPLLTDREAEVLALLAQGLTVAGTARRLSVSTSTVKTHAAHIYGKLGAANRAQAVAEGVRRGVLAA